jgi:predicted Zn-dependent protease
MIRSLAPNDGPTRAIVTNHGSFTVSARPGGELLIDKPATTEVDAEVLAALIAHALAHQQAGHVGVAVGRAEEGNYLGRLTFFRFSRDLVDLEFTREDEAAADQAAIAMMQRAGITLKPAARFFARMNEARLEERYWAQEYAEEHPGLRNRIAVWSAAAASQHVSHQALVERQADALFNICWERPENAPMKWTESKTA